MNEARKNTSGDYKRIVKEAYNTIADAYVKRDFEVIDETLIVKEALAGFIESLPAHGVVLDIGSGGGRDSRYLHERGYAVIGIDISDRLVEEARKINPGIDYRVMDFENLVFPDEEFHGVWANASLHHIPKERIAKVFRDIHRLLKKGGIFFLKVKQGSGEGIKSEEKFGVSIERYLARYKPEELEDMLRSAGFSITRSVTTNEEEWIDVVAKKL